MNIETSVYIVQYGQHFSLHCIDPDMGNHYSEGSFVFLLLYFVGFFRGGGLVIFAPKHLLLIYAQWNCLFATIPMHTHKISSGEKNISDIIISRVVYTVMHDI